MYRLRPSSRTSSSICWMQMTIGLRMRDTCVYLSMNINALGTL
jgi:hypothetical protein